MRPIIVLILGLVCALAQTAQASQFGDRDPVQWTGMAPYRYPVHGIDAARFQEHVDWEKARRAGVAFAFVKATEGGDLLDPKFRSHWQGARRVGIPTGAYHFYYFCTKPRVQAHWFIQNVPKRPGTLPPVLDVEWNPYSPTCTKRPQADEVRNVMAVWLNVVGRHYGQRPIIYTTPDFYKTNELWRFKGEEFWLRSTARTPDLVYPGQPWSFWQYSGTGIVPGFPGDVDLNAFAGSRQQWRKWLKVRAR